MATSKKQNTVQAELPLIVGSKVGSLFLEETYRDYFLQYASYVITERAIPDVIDGCKPVQRRLLYSMWKMDDGRFNKVANIIGNCMQFHPHGDTSIGSALVGMGQKNLLVETQGNWGDPVTGDKAAAPRYIEARLTPFAKEILFATHLTEFKKNYDGRQKEPVRLPVRFPTLLATGAEGIAVGLSTRILPHNFIEIIEAAKAHLCNQPFELYPDFPSGGLIDVSMYNQGKPGGKIKTRAKIEFSGGKWVNIQEIPYGATTTSLIDSIISASNKGKIKLAKIEDNTAAEVDIKVKFQRGVEMDKVIDALYAFTDCEVSHSPNGMLLDHLVPISMGVNEILIRSVEHTKKLHKEDLEYQLEQLEERWHHKSLIQIFIENRIYLMIEKCKTWKSVLATIKKGLQPFLRRLRLVVRKDDLEMLTRVRIRRISAWDAEKAREELLEIDRQIAEVEGYLSNLTQYTIDWFELLLKKYGTGRERKTELKSFDAILAVEVAERNLKLYLDQKAGFVGTEVKGEEIECCSSLDDVLVFLENGGMKVVRTESKVYVGEQVYSAEVFKPENRDVVYNMIYEDTKSGIAWIKRFRIGGVTRDKEYSLCSKTKHPRILFFGKETDGNCVLIRLKKKPRIQTKRYFDFIEGLVKSRSAGGTIISKHKISSIKAISRTLYEKHTGLDS